MLSRRLAVLFAAISVAAVTMSFPANATVAGSVPSAQAFSVTKHVVNKVRPTIAGRPSLGAVLSAHNGTWAPSGTRLTLRWLVDGKAISGATSPTHKVTSTEVGKKITLEVTGQKSGYVSAKRSSVPAGVVVRRQLTATPVPTVLGSRVVDSTLTAIPGSWLPAPVTLTYQWFRNGVTIAGATAKSYTLRAADLGTSTSIKVLGSKIGYVKVTRSSGGLGTVAKAQFGSKPIPTISGSPIVGSTLEATTYAWLPGATTIGLQWFRGADAIPGATAASYEVTPADAGTAISVRETGARAAYETAIVASSPTALVANGDLAGEPVPTIAGLSIEGATVTAEPAAGQLTAAAVSYQWLTGGVPIPGATGRSYVVSDADRGTDLTVQVTETVPGYNPLVLTSRAHAVSPESAAKVARALQTFHTALSGAGSSPVDIFVGPSDSITEGYGATSVDGRWISVLRDDLRRSFQPAGVVGGAGYFDFWNQGSFRDYPVTTENRIEDWSYGLGDESIDLGSSQQTATVTTSMTGLDILYVGSTDGSTGQFHYTVDDGSPVYVDTGTRMVAGGGQIEAIRGLPSGPHTVRIFGEDSGKPVTVEGAMVYDGDSGKGIRLWEGGRSGFTSALFSGEFRGWEDSVGDTNPDLVLMPIGSNDYWVGRSVADTKLYIERIISRLRARVGTNPSIVLVPYYDRSNSSTVPWSDFVQMYYDIAADDPDICVVDLGPLFGPWVGDDRGGLTIGADLVHPSNVGHTLIGDSIAAFLAP